MLRKAGNYNEISILLAPTFIVGIEKSGNFGIWRVAKQAREKVVGGHGCVHPSTDWKRNSSLS